MPMVLFLNNWVTCNILQVSHQLRLNTKTEIRVPQLIKLYFYTENHFLCIPKPYTQTDSRLMLLHMCYESMPTAKHMV